MTADQIPQKDPCELPAEESPGEDSRQQPGNDDISLQELSDVYAELINDQPTPPRPARTEVQNEVNQTSPAIDSLDVSPASILEAILFVGHPENKPLMPRDVARVIRGVSLEEVEQLVVKLNECYQEGSTPYEITSIEGGYLMQLREEAQLLREKFYSKIKDRRLSQAAIDVLAIIAYNQGIT